jgi:hypothetical protein
VALNAWFFIENTAIMTDGSTDDVPPNYTNYAINITNNAPPEGPESQDGFLYVYLVVLTFYF